MSKLESLQSELILKFGEIADICQDYGYDVTPTLLLRHEKGASSSLLLGNDELGKAVLCIAELGDIGQLSSESPHEASIKLLTS